MIIHDWLVVSTPLKNMSSSVGMMKFPIYGNIIQMFQTTNQMISDFWDTSISRVPSVVIWLTLPDSTQKQSNKKHRRAVLHSTFVWKAFFENLKQSKKNIEKQHLGLKYHLRKRSIHINPLFLTTNRYFFKWWHPKSISILYLAPGHIERTAGRVQLLPCGKLARWEFSAVCHGKSAYCNPRKMVLCF